MQIDVSPSLSIYHWLEPAKIPARFEKTSSWYMTGDRIQTVSFLCLTLGRGSFQVNPAGSASKPTFFSLNGK